MANDLNSIGRGPISGGYQGPIVLPGARQGGKGSRPNTTPTPNKAEADATSSRALVPVSRPSSASDIAPIEVLRPSDRTSAAGSVVDLTPLSPGDRFLSDGPDFVVVDGQRYRLGAPRGTYFNFVI